MREITLSEIQPTEKPGDGWFFIEAAGDHSGVAKQGGSRVEFVQHLTPEVLADIAAAGVPAEGLLVDRDHFSRDPEKPSEALGWVRELAVCIDAASSPRSMHHPVRGLAARIEWTPLGLPLIEGKVYRHFSTVYPPPTAEELQAGRVMPRRLIGLALTNQPNNAAGQPPITNRAPGSPTSAAGENGSEDTTPKNKPKNNTMEYNPELLAALKLPEDASDTEVLAAVKALTSRVDDAEKAAADAAESEAETAISTATEAAGVELTPEEKEEAKEEIITNRDHGLRFLNLLCNDKRSHRQSRARRYDDRSKPAPSAILNRKVPADTQEQAIHNRAHEICREAEARGIRKSYYTARAQAQREAGVVNN